MMSPKIMVCLPAYGGSVVSEFFMACIRLQEDFIRRGIFLKFGTLSFPDVVEVRNIFLSIFFDRTDATHLLFIDTDMNFEPQLIVDMLDFDQPIIGVIATKKKYPIEFVGRASKGTENGKEIIVNGHMKVDGI